MLLKIVNTSLASLLQHQQTTEAKQEEEEEDKLKDDLEEDL